VKVRQEGDWELEDRHEPDIGRAEHIRRARKGEPPDWQKKDWLDLVREINAVRAVVDSLPKGAAAWVVRKQDEREAVKKLSFEMDYPERTEFTFDDGTRVEFSEKDVGASVGLVQTMYPHLKIFLK
jgi:hypothetical protein